MRFRHKPASNERLEDSLLDTVGDAGPSPSGTPLASSSTPFAAPPRRKVAARTWCLSTLGLGLALIMLYAALLTFPLPRQRGMTIKTITAATAHPVDDLSKQDEPVAAAETQNVVNGSATEAVSQQKPHDTSSVAAHPDPPVKHSGGTTRQSLYGRLVSSKGAASKQEDELRCRRSAICDGDTSCSGGDKFGCMLDSGARQAAIVNAAEWAWKGYKDFAWGEDELMPVSRNSSKWFRLGLTLVDGLDTLMMMGLHGHVRECRQWVAEHLNMDQGVSVNTFETTIRILGGLLSAYHISGGDRMYLYRALELGLRLLPAFNSPTGIPMSDVDLQSHVASHPHWSSLSSLSEVSTLDVEFSYLARIASRPELEFPALNVMDLLSNMSGKTGHLAPMYVCPIKGKFKGNQITLGARADSYYEYLLKEWIITGKKHDWLLQMYVDTIVDVRQKLFQKSRANGLLYVSELERDGLSPKMDHLVCFLPGLFALGHLHGVNTSAPGEADDLQVAEDLATTCYEMYRQTPTGLAPEIVHFIPEDTDFPKQHRQDVGNGDFFIKPMDGHNLLRPETVESIFILWRVTRKQMYRDWGWNIFRSFEKYTRVGTGGYTSLHDVTSVPPLPRDKMESFWLAETLKYLYLLFDDGVLDPATGKRVDRFPLTDYVFNTEAHPLPVSGSSTDVKNSKDYLMANDDRWSWHGTNSSLDDLEADIMIALNEGMWFGQVDLQGDEDDHQRET